MNIGPLTPCPPSGPRRQRPLAGQAVDEPKSGPGKIRHVLHGWRSLAASVVVQSLPAVHVVAPTTSPAAALEAYRRRCEDLPAPRGLRVI